MHPHYLANDKACSERFAEKGFSVACIVHVQISITN